MTDPTDGPPTDGPADQPNGQPNGQDDGDQQPVEPATSYEQARDELADVVAKLEAGGTTLEEALRLWERGEELARACQSWLEGARARLEATTSAGDEPADEVEDLEHE